MSEEFTPQLIASRIQSELEGADPEPEELEAEGGEAQEAAEPQAPEVDRVAELQRANAGLLAELRSTRQERKEFSEELKKFREAQEAIQNPPEPEPDPDTQPAEWLAFQQKKTAAELKAELGGVKSDLEQERLMRAEVQRTQQYQNVMKAAETQFLSNSEDYTQSDVDSVGQYMIESAHQQFQAAGHSPQEAAALVREAIIQYTDNAVRNGMNPVEAAINDAQKMGWKRAAAPEQNGQRAKPQANPDILAKSVASGSPLSSGGSGNTGSRITLDDFDSLDQRNPELYSKIIASPQLWEKLNVEGHVFV